MEPGFIDLTAENIADQHLCCIIRSKKPHPGVEAKRRWLVDRLPEGHVFRKLDVKEKVFIEYAPLETAWVPVEGDNYLYLYCLWVAGAYKGKGYGRALMEHCLADARDRGKSGICMLGAEKQKAWLSARSFDGTLPRFTDQARAGTIEEKALTIYYSDQCPYAVNSLEIIRQVCGEAGAPYSLVPVDTLEKAKALPGVFNNYAVFYGGAFQTVNLLDAASLRRLLKR